MVKDEGISSSYVLAYYNSNLFYLFCMNNNIYQANYKDGSHIIISSTNIIYSGVNKKKVIIKSSQIN